MRTEGTGSPVVAGLPASGKSADRVIPVGLHDSPPSSSYDGPRNRVVIFRGARLMVDRESPAERSRSSSAAVSCCAVELAPPAAADGSGPQRRGGGGVRGYLFDRTAFEGEGAALPEQDQPSYASPQCRACVVSRALNRPSRSGVSRRRRLLWMR